MVRSVYSARDRRLRLLGFASYQQYLQSDLWKSIRGRVLAKQPECRICRLRKATEIHHRSYKTEYLTGEKTSQLIPICRSCHESIEFSVDGNKLPLCSANAKMRQAQHKRKCGVKRSELAPELRRPATAK